MNNLNQTEEFSVIKHDKNYISKILNITELKSNIPIKDDAILLSDFKQGY